MVPCTREATLVHMIDNLGGELGSFDRLEKELPAGEQWVGVRQGARWRSRSSAPPADAERDSRAAGLDAAPLTALSAPRRDAGSKVRK